MKVRTASGKKHRQTQEGHNSEEPVTPKVKRTFSVTNTNYLQLQLDASGKKRGNLQKMLTGKDKRIAELQKEVREYQEVIVGTGTQMRDLKTKYEQQRARTQHMQQQLKDAVNLCRNMKDKCHELVQSNQTMKKEEGQWRARAGALQRKLKEMKQVRRRQKKQIKEFLITFLKMCTQNKLDPQFAKKFIEQL